MCYNLHVTAHYAFGDEASGPEADSDYFVFVMLVMPQSRPVITQVRRLMRRIGKKLVGNEIKAAQVGRKIVGKLLRALAQLDLAVVAIVVDKRGIAFADPARVYRQTVARTMRRCAERWPDLDITLDKRYTAPGPQTKLERAIAEILTDEQRAHVRVRSGVSYQIKSLQAADCVAWALWQKYERGNEELYRVMAAKIVWEEIVRGKAKSGLPGL